MLADTSTLFRENRTAITRTQTIILIVVLLAAVVAGEIALSNSNKTSGGTIGIDLHVIEDNPVLQIDHFYPDTIYVPLNESISLAIQNGDDETRVFTLSQYNINVTIISGTTQRVTLRSSTARQLLVHLSHIAPQRRERQFEGPMPRGVLRGDAERDVADEDHHATTSTVGSPGNGGKCRAGRQLHRAPLDSSFFSLG